MPSWLKPWKQNSKMSMTDETNYKSYTDLTKEDTKELAEAVTKLGEPLSQMGVILDGK